MHSGLERTADEFGDREAILHGDRRWTYRQLDRGVNAFARHLASRGVAAGDRVALMMGNRPEFVVAALAVSKLGAAAVLVNPAWKALELRHAVDLTGPRHAVGDASTTGLLGAHFEGADLTDVDCHPELAEGLADRPGGGTGTASGGDSLFVFSSGTTGLPKAARHTHASMTAAVDHWQRALGLGSTDRFQVATPPSHILGLLNLLTAIEAGATVRMHARFDLDEVLRRISGERMTLEMAVAPIALAMANHPDIERYDLSSLRYIMWGATPVTPSVARTVTERTGVRWLPAYGATELPVIAANPVSQPDRWRLDSAGLPVPGVTLRVADLDTETVLASGETGEIQARSPSLMAGYFPEHATAGAFSDGWYRTGDVGWLEPEGWVHLTDRSKEMIKVNGFQVAPAELEGVLLGHPAVADCAVFGVPDERAGEVPVAAVQLDASRSVTTEELMQLVSESLASYKRLSHVVFVDAVPRLPSGKALRRELRDLWSEPTGTGRSC